MEIKSGKLFVSIINIHGFSLGRISFYSLGRIMGIIAYFDSGVIFWSGDQVDPRLCLAQVKLRVGFALIMLS